MCMCVGGQKSGRGGGIIGGGWPRDPGRGKGVWGWKGRRKRGLTRCGRWLQAHQSVLVCLSALRILMRNHPLKPIRTSQSRYEQSTPHLAMLHHTQTMCFIYHMTCADLCVIKSTMEAETGGRGVSHWGWNWLRGERWGAGGRATRDARRVTGYGHRVGCISISLGGGGLSSTLAKVIDRYFPWHR